MLEFVSISLIGVIILLLLKKPKDTNNNDAITNNVNEYFQTHYSHNKHRNNKASNESNISAYNYTNKQPRNNTNTTSNRSIASSHKKIVGKNAVKGSFVVFDVETTGLHAGNDEIIEIAAIKIADINSSNHKTFNALIKPKKSIPANITKLTGITNDMVNNADDINTVLKDFCEFIEDYPLVGHNIDFDVKFVNNKANKANIDFKNKKLIDTLPLARKAFPDLSNHKLPTLVKHIGIDVDRSHRAFDDVKATLFVYTVSTKLLYGK